MIWSHETPAQQLERPRVSLALVFATILVCANVASGLVTLAMAS
jgi:hypothetical protein